MLAHGFSLALTARLIRAGLATDRMPKASGPGRGRVARVRITEAGRQALGEYEPSPSPSLLFVQARGNLIRILEQALAAASQVPANGTHYQAFSWTAKGGMVGLGVLPGYNFSTAQGVNADGSVVVGQNQDVAMRWA
jgi:uncharacterized membrane protein